MPQLIQIRQRMKAITTIAKVTHAMRLISMSSHARLKEKEKIARTFKDEIQNLIGTIIPTAQAQPTNPIIDNQLFIIIGSQKGLCGTFNNSLLQCVLKQNLTAAPTTFIVIGKKIQSLIQSKYPTIASATSAAYETLTAQNYASIANDIAAKLAQPQSSYSHVAVINNHSRSFFLQEPRVTVLTQSYTQEVDLLPENQLLWDLSPVEVVNHLASLQVTATLNYLLCASLLSEYSARFVSMDSATRNASTLLEKTKLEYNKLRQAKITRELTELSGGFVN